MGRQKGRKFHTALCLCSDSTSRSTQTAPSQSPGNRCLPAAPASPCLPSGTSSTKMTDTCSGPTKMPPNGPRKEQPRLLSLIRLAIHNRNAFCAKQERDPAPERVAPACHSLLPSFLLFLFTPSPKRPEASFLFLPFSFSSFWFSSCFPLSFQRQTKPTHIASLVASLFPCLFPFSTQNSIPPSTHPSKWRTVSRTRAALQRRKKKKRKTKMKMKTT